MWLANGPGGEHHCHMTTTAPSQQVAEKRRPTVPPVASRDLLLPDMLARTGRHGVPIRRRFLQTDGAGADGSRAATLAKMLRGRDGSTLDAYLLIHAMASASEPYRAAYFSSSWVRLMRFDQDAAPAAASSRWSKTATRLEKLKLIERKRVGNVQEYHLLDEAGNGDPYKRPTKLADGRWFSLPYEYWLDGWDAKLSTAEKVMLLIALDQPDGFQIPYDRFSKWYGVSESTAKRGLTGLARRGIIDVHTDWHSNGRSEFGWVEVRSYTTVGIWSKSERDALMKTKPKRHTPIVFVPVNAEEGGIP